MSLGQVDIEGLTFVWVSTFEDDGTFAGWTLREPYGIKARLVYVYGGRNAFATRGWYLEGPEIGSQFVSVQPPPFSATLEAASKTLLDMR